jgi:hypothetical protein
MPAIDTTYGITDEFVRRLAERAREAEDLRRLPDATVADLVASGFTDLLVPKRYGGQQTAFPAILDPVRRMAAGCRYMFAVRPVNPPRPSSSSLRPSRSACNRRGVLPLRRWMNDSIDSAR